MMVALAFALCWACQPAHGFAHDHVGDDERACVGGGALTFRRVTR